MSEQGRRRRATGEPHPESGVVDESINYVFEMRLVRLAEPISVFDSQVTRWVGDELASERREETNVCAVVHDSDFGVEGVGWSSTRLLDCIVGPGLEAIVQGAAEKGWPIVNGNGALSRDQNEGAKKNGEEED